MYASRYIKLAVDRSHRNILLVYVSAYGYTKEAAKLIAEGILETKEINVDISDIENISVNELEFKN